MRSKTSNPKSPRPWRAEPACSEPELRRVAGELASELRAGDRVLLEGPLGAGKSTFARELLTALGSEQPAEGSPTFAIAHEYRAKRVPEVIHIDFYRLRSEDEIEDAGIPSYFWEREAVVIAEWLSLFPGFERDVLRADPAHRNWRIDLSIVEDQPDARSLVIARA